MVLVILGIAAIFAFKTAVYLLNRNNEVYNFRISVSDLCYERSMKIIKQHKYIFLEKANNDKRETIK